MRRFSTVLCFYQTHFWVQLLLWSFLPQGRRRESCPRLSEARMTARKSTKSSTTSLPMKTVSLQNVAHRFLQPSTPCTPCSVARRPAHLQLRRTWRSNPFVYTDISLFVLLQLCCSQRFKFNASLGNRSQAAEGGAIGTGRQCIRGAPTATSQSPRPTAICLRASTLQTRGSGAAPDARAPCSSYSSSLCWSLSSTRGWWPSWVAALRHSLLELAWPPLGRCWSVTATLRRI